MVFAGLDVSGWVKGANGLTVDVESAPGPLDGKKSAMITDRKKAAVDKNGHFRVKLKMVDGENCVSVKFQGTRIGGMSILVDNSAPYILITEPLDKHKTKEGTVKVKGIVRDPHLVSVDVDGVAAKVTGETFEAEVPVPVIGKNYVTANAYDSAGNVPRRVVISAKRLISARNLRLCY